MKSILFILFFCKVVCCAQPIVLDGIYVDSLVQNVKYAEANLLKVQDKYALITTLLKYKGNINVNPTWTTNFNPSEFHSMTHPEPTKTTNQAVALYLIEATIRDSFFFKKGGTTYVTYKKNDKLVLLCNIIPEYYFSSKKNYKKITREIENHYKYMYHLYNSWFKKIKNSKRPFKEAIKMRPLPLPTQYYSWGKKLIKK